MAKKDSSYDKRLYDGNLMGCWVFGLGYIIATVVSFFKPSLHDTLPFFGIFVIVLCLYEISRSHSNIENIVDRHRLEIDTLTRENRALKDELYDLKH